jgi:transketolase
MCSSAKAAHIGSSLSVIDILAVLYSGSAHVAPSTVDDPDRDVVIVSKGHAAAGVYAVLAHAGFFPLGWLDDYCVDGRPLGGHVTRGEVPGVELSTGSLGHGLPFGVGVALGLRLRGSPAHVYVVMSDGELDEGSNWEAALLAAHHDLRNLTVVVDRNGIQSLGPTEATVRLEPLAAKWSAFGWDTADVDGHDQAALGVAIAAARTTQRPTVLIAHTTKGYGVSFMQDQVLWHYRPPTGDALDQALRELGEP